MPAWYSYPITHGYISGYDASQWDTPHYAVDIGTPFHTPITAIKSGKVVQADYAVWAGQPGGGEVFIKPDDGSPEYYFYHFDRNEVVTGQHVNAGQEIGLSGGQNVGGEHPVSTMWSSGLHLHAGFFDKFIDTPIGTRPYGPDITPTLNFLKTGGAYGNGTVSQQASVATNNADVVAVAKAGLTKIAVFIVAIVVVLAGAYLVFQKQINSAVSKGKGLAEKAVLLAV
jgi:hypothetical protein